MTPITPKPSNKTELKRLFEEVILKGARMDRALSQLPTESKDALARALGTLLRRPFSFPKSLGISVAAGAPWNLNEAGLQRWPVVAALAEKLREQAPDAARFNAAGTPEDFPPWVREELKVLSGPDRSLDVLSSLGHPPPLSLRVNRSATGCPGVESLQASLQSYLQSRVGGEHKVAFSELAPFGLRLPGYAPVMQAPGFDEGYFELQDEGSQLMALFALDPTSVAGLLGISPGKHPKRTHALAPDVKSDSLVVIDACAGAGGKSLALADALGGRGRVYAYDVSETKLQALRRRAKRTGFNNLQAVLLEKGGEHKVIDRFEKTADIVLVDAPCSGWGVLRRNPDIKWKTQAEEWNRLERLQRELLATYSKLVKPGGRLVYGVCTFRSAETLEVAGAFGSAHPEFVAEQGGYLGPDLTDGFFFQSWVRSVS